MRGRQEQGNPLALCLQLWREFLMLPELEVGRKGPCPRQRGRGPAF